MNFARRLLAEDCIVYAGAWPLIGGMFATPSDHAPTTAAGQPAR